MTSPNATGSVYWVENLSELQQEFAHSHDAAAIERVFREESHDVDRARRILSYGSSGVIPCVGSEAGTAPPTAAEVVERTQDLFALGSDWALAHCVSRDMRMGKGIAVEFKRRFEQVEELKAQGKEPGEVATLRIPVPTSDNPRHIFYLVTKELYKNKPTYDNLRNSLLAMRHVVISEKVGRIGMPRIGCGLDGLKWENVLPMIVECFSGTGIKICICSMPLSKPAFVGASSGEPKQGGEGDAER